jgi:hypothetical protein
MEHSTPQKPRIKYADSEIGGIGMMISLRRRRMRGIWLVRRMEMRMNSHPGPQVYRAGRHRKRLEMEKVQGMNLSP